MVSKFWIDSDDLSTGELCVRLHVEVDIHPMSFEIYEIRCEDTGRLYEFGHIPESDKMQITNAIKRTQGEQGADLWGKWVWGRNGR